MLASQSRNWTPGSQAIQGGDWNILNTKSHALIVYIQAHMTIKNYEQIRNKSKMDQPGLRRLCTFPW